MFYHLVFWKFRDEYREDLPEAVRILKEMRQSIDVIRDLRTGIDVLHSSRSWDLGLMVTLDSPRDLDTYDQHPAHLPVKEWMRQRAEAGASVDFED